MHNLKKKKKEEKKHLAFVGIESTHNEDECCLKVQNLRTICNIVGFCMFTVQISRWLVLDSATAFVHLLDELWNNDKPFKY